MIELNYRAFREKVSKEFKKMKINIISKKLKAVSSLKRLLIIRKLKSSKRSTNSEIASYINLSYKSTNRHLQVLINSEIINNETVNGYVVFFLNKNQEGFIKNVIKNL